MNKSLLKKIQTKLNAKLGSPIGLAFAETVNVGYLHVRIAEEFRNIEYGLQTQESGLRNIMEFATLAVLKLEEVGLDQVPF